jgi:hypothetical protein
VQPAIHSVCMGSWGQILDMPHPVGKCPFIGGVTPPQYRSAHNRNRTSNCPEVYAPSRVNDKHLLRRTLANVLFLLNMGWPWVTHLVMCHLHIFHVHNVFQQGHLVLGLWCYCTGVPLWVGFSGGWCGSERDSGTMQEPGVVGSTGNPYGGELSEAP